MKQIRYQRYFEENHKRINETTSKHPINKDFFIEAVFRPDNYVNMLMEELQDFLRFFDGQEFSSKIEVCQMLTKYFNTYNIKFKYLDTCEQDESAIISMETGTQSTLIIVYCDNNISEIFSNKQIQNNFEKQFELLIGHELIHRAKFLTLHQTKFTDKISQYVKQGKDFKSYLSSDHELMAYAWQIIESLRFENADDNDIKSFIKNKGNFKNYKNDIYSSYITYYNDTKILNRLHKYMYEYIEGDMNKNHIEVPKL